MKGLVAVLLGFVVSSCGSSSGGNSAALCQEGTVAICDKVFDCPEAADIRQFFGATKAECVTSLNAQCSMNNACEPGQTYHADQARTCVDGIKASSCADFVGGGGAGPAACDAVCTGGTTQ
jgi:hypothetical protein